MQTVDGTAVVPVKSEDIKELETDTELVNIPFQQMDQRASAKTAVLNAILARQERGSWHHWGLNE